MGLKDVSKIVANQIAREKAQEEAASAPSTPKASDTGPELRPGTNKPMDVSNHIGFKFDSSNPFHKDIFKTLLNNGVSDKIAIHEGGIMSVPREIVYDAQYARKFQTAIETGGGEKRFKGEAAKVTPRKAETKSAPAARPTPPKNLKPSAPKKAVAPSNEIKEDLRNLFGGAPVRVDPEIAAKREAEKKAAAAKEEKERKAARRRASR